MIQESLRTGLRCAARAKGVGVVFPETRLVGPPHPVSVRVKILLSRTYCKIQHKQTTR